MPNILKQAQAEALYRAMTELNNLGGSLDTVFSDGRHRIGVVFRPNAGVSVSRWLPGSFRKEQAEVHGSQAAFAEVYGL